MIDHMEFVGKNVNASMYLLGELWTFLLEMKIISATSRIHDRFGDIDRLLKKVRHCCYLL